MNTTETLNKVRTLLGIKVKFEQMKLENGAILEAEAFEVGQDIFVVADEERVPVPVGEYVTDDGMAILISEEGVIADIKQVDAAEPEQEEEVVAEEEELEAEKPKKVVESVSTETFFAAIDKLTASIEELKLAKVEVKEVKPLELSEEKPKSIKHNPEAGTEQKKMHLYAQNSRDSIENRIFKKLNK